jgi:hypothetical protein
MQFVYQRLSVVVVADLHVTFRGTVVADGKSLTYWSLLTSLFSFHLFCCANNLITNRF